MSGRERSNDIEPLRHECPHCGVGKGAECEETGPFGPTGVLRSPHPERREIAKEVSE